MVSPVLFTHTNYKGTNSLRSTYIWDVGSLVLSELFVVTQEEDGVFQGQSMVEIALSLAFCCALHLQRHQKVSERVATHAPALNAFPHYYPPMSSHLLQLSQEAVQGLIRQLTHLKHGYCMALQILEGQRQR